MTTDTTTNLTNDPATDTKTLSAKDILSRSSGAQTQTSAPAHAASDVSVDDVKGAVKLEDIKDVAARSFVEKRLKELESGFNKKYEQLANIRKDYESKINSMNSWTPERLDQTLKDPAFVSLVQARQQQTQASQPPAGFDGSADDWSALTPEEKQQFKQLNDKVSAQEQFMLKMLQEKEDDKLKNVYPDYDAKTVDQIQSDLLSGRLIATREHLWKVANFERAVERAYQLGISDRKDNIIQKQNASSSSTAAAVTPANEVPEDVRKKGFGAIGRWRLEQFKAGKK